MLLSYKWLQSYFDEKLPPPEALAERIMFGFSEVEGIEKSPLEKGALPSSAGGLLQPSAAAPLDRGKQPPTHRNVSTPFSKGDTIFDIKVLPDRACYALSHRGVAYEVAALLGLQKKEFNWPQPKIHKTRPLSVRVDAPELCSRYMARMVENVTVRELPWVKERLEAVGQRTIHPIVDGANLVMFDMGQPLHAFDADKVEGGIIVRRARRGEKITTLDDREVALDTSVLIIADEKSPLAIAGIKGGKKAEVTAETRNIILESANFNASHMRKTAEKLGIKTDASKRFENKLSPEMASVGMNDFSAYLFGMNEGIKAGEIVDVYSHKLKGRKLKVESNAVRKKLGVAVSDTEIEDVFSRLQMGFEKSSGGWTLTPPVFRMDLNIAEDIAEEVGRIVGYDKIPAVLPPKKNGAIETPKSFYYEWKIREILAKEGFSEVMTSSFMPHGDVEIEKPLAEDKSYARSELWWNFDHSLATNNSNSPLFGNSEVRQFEMGKVFPKSGERLSLAIGCVSKKGARQIITNVVSEIERILGGSLGGKMEGGQNEYECNLDVFIEGLPEPKQWDIAISPAQNKKFTPFSSYPFIVRDVALFVSPLEKGVSDSGRRGVVYPPAEEVAKIIRENAGDLVVRGPELFDEFSKDGKKSLAFRLVFQSFDRTLTDAEVNKVMEKVYAVLRAKGWEVR
ncbi:MAG: phenylalanine--tRNA ligase subunit beta [Patescibacteria group bacterium]